MLPSVRTTNSNLPSRVNLKKIEFMGKVSQFLKNEYFTINTYQNKK